MDGWADGRTDIPWISNSSIFSDHPVFSTQYLFSSMVANGHCVTKWYQNLSSFFFSKLRRQCNYKAKSNLHILIVSMLTVLYSHIKTPFEFYPDFQTITLSLTTTIRYTFIHGIAKAISYWPLASPVWASWVITAINQACIWTWPDLVQVIVRRRDMYMVQRVHL